MFSRRFSAFQAVSQKLARMRCDSPWKGRAAFEALLRRLASARSQELAVIESPRRGPFGGYTLGSPQAAGLLPYDLRLLSLDPVEARCDCPDFLRSSLGLCKHVLAVVDHLARKPREWKAALEAPRIASPNLSWDATLVPAGPFDPLSALVLLSPANGLSPSCQRTRVPVRRHGPSAVRSRDDVDRQRSGATASGYAELALHRGPRKARDRRKLVVETNPTGRHATVPHCVRISIAESHAASRW